MNQSGEYSLFFGFGVISIWKTFERPEVTRLKDNSHFSLIFVSYWQLVPSVMLNTHLTFKSQTTL